MKLFSFLIISILCLFIGERLFAQEELQVRPDLDASKIEALLIDLESARDTNRVKLLINLAWAHRNINPPKAQEYGERALLLSKELDYRLGMARALNHLGLIYNILGNYQKALGLQRESIEISRKIGNQEGVATSYQNLGSTYKEQADYQKAADAYQESINIAREMGDSSRMASPLNNLGSIYQQQGDYEQAQKYYEEALAIYTQNQDSLGIGIILNNLGEIFEKTSQPYEALEKYIRALQIFEKQNDITRVSKLAHQIGQTHLGLGNLKSAENVLLRALNLAKDFKLRESTRDITLDLSRLYARQERWQEAFKYQDIFVRTQDSLIIQEKSQQISKMQDVFNDEKRRSQLALLEKEKIIQKEEKLIRNIFQYGLWLALAFISVFALLLYRGNLKFRNRNRVLKSQSQEIEDKNLKLVEKHREISSKNEEFQYLMKELKQNNVRMSDSIRYAERIQRAILPTEEQFRERFQEHFVIFKPRDVVSGDFYWFAEVDKYSFVAVVDCTGHGVPGAFMSMIGNTLLGEIITQDKVWETNLILEHLHEGVRQALHQSESSNRDGMDLAICRIETPSDIHAPHTIQFSGAKSTIYYCADGNLVKLRGDRKSIGGWQKEQKRVYTQQEFSLKRGDSLYFATDGYTDAANHKRKKLGYRTLESILKEKANKSLKEQAVALLEKLYQHQGQIEQRDDVTLLGLKL